MGVYIHAYDVVGVLGYDGGRRWLWKNGGLVFGGSLGTCGGEKIWRAKNVMAAIFGG